MPVRLLPAHGVGGGMERLSWTIARGLADLGHQVSVVTTEHPAGLGADVEPNLDVYYVPGSTWRRYQRSWWDQSYARLADEHARDSYDVILSQSAGGLGYLDRASLELELPTVVLLHGSARASLRTAWRGRHGLRGVYRLGRLIWQLPPQVLRWRRSAGSVAHWLAVSEEVAVDTARELGLPRSRITTVPIGVDTERFQPDPVARANMRAELGIPEVAPVIALATRLEREKGVQVALAAASRLRTAYPELRLVIAGRGHHERQLHRQAKRLGLADACSFLGLVDHHRLPAILAAADIFAFPSLCAEARPVSVVEASAAGLPVVATESAGTRGLVLPGTTALLVRRGDASALAGALSALLTDESGRRRMGERAREVAASGGSVPAMIAVVEQALEAVTGARRS